ncbi:MAG: ATP synthase F1 subunit epsilon, partial [Bdellovibrionales bacterium]|nr:ATP synthase F1 subunit epsilon [Bdellovibrionales bacterium]
MAKELQLQILTPGRELFSGSVSELLLPSFDGEIGVLPAHEDFIGLLGTGVMKIVHHGNDYWFMVSSGVYEVRGSSVTVLAEVAEAAESVDVDTAKAQEAALAPEVSAKSSFEPEYEDLATEYQRARARIEVHRRTHLVN